MMLQVKEYFEKPLIVIYCLKRRMDEGLKTRTVDIVSETGLTKKVVYLHVESLEKQNLITVTRKNLKNIYDIRLTSSSLKELNDQTLDILLHEGLRRKVKRVINRHDSENRKNLRKDFKRTHDPSTKS